MGYKIYIVTVLLRIKTIDRTGHHNRPGKNGCIERHNRPDKNGCGLVWIGSWIFIIRLTE